MFAWTETAGSCGFQVSTNHALTDMPTKVYLSAQQRNGLVKLMQLPCPPLTLMRVNLAAWCMLINPCNYTHQPHQ